MKMCGWVGARRVRERRVWIAILVPWLQGLGGQALHPGGQPDGQKVWFADGQGGGSLCNVNFCLSQEVESAKKTTAMTTGGGGFHGTPKIVAQQLAELIALFTEVGIIVGGKIVHPGRVWCTDEKGYSQRGMSRPKRVFTKGAASTGTSGTGHNCFVCCSLVSSWFLVNKQQGDAEFEHISVLGFVNMAGDSTGPGVAMCLFVCVVLYFVLCVVQES